MPDPSHSLKLYRWLLKFYPSAFREEYAIEMESAFRDELAEASGVFALAALWGRLLVDLASTIPQQLWDEIGQDAKQTVRLWANRPWHTGFAVLALAIGIGANTGVFSVVNGLLLRSLPFVDPDRLASTQTYLVPHDSAKQFHDWCRQSTYLSDAAVVEQADFNIASEQSIVRAHVARTSANFFGVLGAKPVLGRAFSTGEDTAGRNALAVIAYGLWQQMFGGSERVLGARVRVNGALFTIVGVAPAEFGYPGNTALWMAAEFGPGNNGWETIGRLKQGVSWTQARAAFTAEMNRLARNHDRVGAASSHRRLLSLRDQLAGSVKRASLLLMAGVVLTLLIACANVANLQLARNADRAAELSIRSALGASRVRIIQQLLTECLLLSFVATAAGLAIGFWTTSIASKLLPPPLAAQAYSEFDGRVLGFTAALAFLSSLLCGLLPAFTAGGVHAFGTRGRSAVRGSRLIRETLVAAQVMLTIILLAASVSLGRAFVRQLQTDRGFDARGLVTVSASLEGTTHEQTRQQLAYFEEVLSRIRGLPDIQSASVTNSLPLYANGFTGGPWGLDGRPPRANSMTVPVLAHYFETMGGRLLYGRDFTEAEVRSDARVVVVDEIFARQFGDPGDAIGHQVTLGKRASRKIVGVVKGMDYMSDEVKNESQIFFPAHTPGDFFLAFVVRVKGRAEDHLAMIRDAVHGVDPRVPVFNAKTMEQRLQEALSRPQLYRTSLLFFAGFGFLLAVIGVYGVVAYAVARRAHEMGVRLALGTTPTRLRRQMLAEGLFPVATGALLGAGGALLSGRFLDSLIEGARSIEPATFVLSILSILLVASTSIWAGSRRIARLDVLEILRVE